MLSIRCHEVPTGQPPAGPRPGERKIVDHPTVMSCRARIGIAAGGVARTWFGIAQHANASSSAGDGVGRRESFQRSKRQVRVSTIHMVLRIMPIPAGWNASTAAYAFHSDARTGVAAGRVATTARNTAAALAASFFQNAVSRFVPAVSAR